MLVHQCRSQVRAARAAFENGKRCINDRAPRIVPSRRHAIVSSRQSRERPSGSVSTAIRRRPQIITQVPIAIRPEPNPRGEVGCIKAWIAVVDDKSTNNRSRDLDGERIFVASRVVVRRGIDPGPRLLHHVLINIVGEDAQFRGELAMLGGIERNRHERRFTRSNHQRHGRRGRRERQIQRDFRVSKQLQPKDTQSRRPLILQREGFGPWLRNEGTKVDFAARIGHVNRVVNEHSQLRPVTQSLDPDRVGIDKAIGINAELCHQRVAINLEDAEIVPPNAAVQEIAR